VPDYVLEVQIVDEFVFAAHVLADRAFATPVPAAQSDA
jgi:hypothetical protein